MKLARTSILITSSVSTQATEEAYLTFCEAALHVKPHLIPSSNWTPVPRFSARSFTLLSALSVARLARRRMVGFDGRGRFLWRGSRPRPRTLIRAHPLFRILQRFAALSPVAGDD